MLSLIIKLVIKHGKKLARKALKEKDDKKENKYKVNNDQTMIAVLVIINLVLIAVVIALLCKK